MMNMEIVFEVCVESATNKDAFPCQDTYKEANKLYKKFDFFDLKEKFGYEPDIKYIKAVVMDEHGIEGNISSKIIKKKRYH